MKTFLAYLTFAALLALCYIEKINAEAAKSRVRARADGYHAQVSMPAWADQRTALAQVRE